MQSLSPIVSSFEFLDNIHYGKYKSTHVTPINIICVAPQLFITSDIIDDSNIKAIKDRKIKTIINISNTSVPRISRDGIYSVHYNICGGSPTMIYGLFGTTDREISSTLLYGGNVLIYSPVNHSISATIIANHLLHCKYDMLGYDNNSNYLHDVINEMRDLCGFINISADMYKLLETVNTIYISMYISATYTRSFPDETDEGIINKL